MATKRDLVEAHSFSRRRLVTAFVSGAPGGREVEPARPARTVLAGLALAVLLLAGAAIAGVLLDRDPADWKEPGLLLTKDRGGLYAILEEGPEPVLHPVLNLTSGQLIMGSDAEPTVVSGETVAEQELGATLGIFGAPEQVPDESRLIDSGWTACTADGAGLAFAVSEEPQVRAAPDAGFTVRSGEDLYLIAQGREERDRPVRAHRYAVPVTPGTDALLGALGVPGTAEAVDVPEEWLSLFPAGGTLTHDSFGLDDFGEPAPETGGDGLPVGSLVGQVVTVDGEDPQLLTGGGPVDLDPFALEVYLAVDHPSGVDVGPVDLDSAPRVAGAVEPFLDAHWPDRLLGSVLTDPCAVLDAEGGEMPVVRLATEPAGTASAEDVPAGSRRVTVDDGHGAHVRSGGWEDTTSETAYLVDPLGRAHPLEGAETADHLGYAGHEPPLVPDPWMELFDAGVVLSRDAALCPPTRVPGDRACGSAASAGESAAGESGESGR